jgi:hypothetical protein
VLREKRRLKMVLATLPLLLVAHRRLNPQSPARGREKILKVLLKLRFKQLLALRSWVEKG